MLQTLKDQYTKADLDDLAAEEKQAWLEVCEERENGTSSGVAVDQALTYDIIDSRGTSYSTRFRVGQPNLIRAHMLSIRILLRSVTSYPPTKAT